LGKGCEKEVKEMAEKLKCPYCEAEFKNSRALGSHVRYKHPRELGLATPPQEEPEEKEVPDAARDFELLLNDYGVTKAPIIVKNIAATGSSDVFDDPKQLAKKLAKWPRDMAPMYRASILERWLKSRGIILPEELLEEIGMEEEEKKERAKKTEAEKKQRDGAAWTVDVESGVPKIRMIRDETEPGVTLAEAEVAAKEIGKEREERRQLGKQLRKNWWNKRLKYEVLKYKKK